MWEVAKMYHLCKDPQSARDRILKFVVGGYRHPKRQYRELLERFEQVEIQPVPLSKKDPEIVYAPLVYLEFMLGMRQKTGVIAYGGGQRPRLRSSAAAVRPNGHPNIGS